MIVVRSLQAAHNNLARISRILIAREMQQWAALLVDLSDFHTLLLTVFLLSDCIFTNIFLVKSKKLFDYKYCATFLILIK